MKHDEKDNWVYDKEEFLAMSETERDNLMFYIADLLNDFAEYARQSHKIAEGMLRLT